VARRIAVVAGLVAALAAVAPATAAARPEGHAVAGTEGEVQV